MSLPSTTQVPRYWFPAKRYGWGWGLPVTWQSWTVFALYLAALVIFPFIALPSTHPGAFAVGLFVLSVLLATVCWLKGEPPRWRWGSGQANS